jgi:hypothetical protein
LRDFPGTPPWIRGKQPLSCSRRNPALDYIDAQKPSGFIKDRGNASLPVGNGKSHVLSGLLLVCQFLNVLQHIEFECFFYE